MIEVGFGYQGPKPSSNRHYGRVGAMLRPRIALHYDTETGFRFESVYSNSSRTDILLSAFSIFTFSLNFGIVVKYVTPSFTNIVA